jgi:putative ABC transport system ATP-binding protein
MAMAMTRDIIEVRGLSKSYRIGSRMISILNDISFSVAPGEFIVIEGNSGSGKSTLLSLLSGLDRPSRGSIWLNGRDIVSLSEDQLAPLRNKEIGFIFQAFHLVPSLNALENVMFPAELSNDSAAQDKAVALLRRVGMEDRLYSTVHQLSGGEKQRVAICRALINRPPLVFGDEPTGNLDSANSAGVIEVLVELHKELGTTLIIATHSAEIAELADRRLCLHDGRLDRAGGA